MAVSNIQNQKVLIGTKEREGRFSFVEGKEHVDVKEIGCIATLLTHNKTGARVLKLYTQSDDNKVRDENFRAC